MINCWSSHPKVGFVFQGNVPSRESIHIYYQRQIHVSVSRESGLNRPADGRSACSPQELRTGQPGSELERQDSASSHESPSRYQKMTGSGHLHVNALLTVTA